MKVQTLGSLKYRLSGGSAPFASLLQIYLSNVHPYGVIGIGMVVSMSSKPIDVLIVLF